MQEKHENKSKKLYSTLLCCSCTAICMRLTDIEIQTETRYTNSYWSWRHFGREQYFPTSGNQFNIRSRQ